MPTNPAEVLKEMRRLIYGGAKPRLDLLSRDELVAMAALINEGEAEIISEACKPFVARVVKP